MLPFYAFVGKLHTLLKTVAAEIHLICETLIGLERGLVDASSPKQLGLRRPIFEEQMR
jgi:hypothetical protein